ncbi:hypothetical protein ACFL5L_02825 [candidate division KSB1 bacterium]
MSDSNDSHRMPTDKKACPMCGEEIWSIAKICKHCNSYQNKLKRIVRTYLFLLSYIVTACTFIAFVFSIYHYLTKQENSRINIELLEIISNENITLLASNDGEKPGKVTDITLRFTRPQYVNEGWRNYTFPLKMDIDTTKINPGDRILISPKKNDKEIISFLNEYPFFYKDFDFDLFSTRFEIIVINWDNSRSKIDVLVPIQYAHEIFDRFR